MELGKKMQDAINEQIREELASSYIYLSMAAYFESVKTFLTEATLEKNAVGKMQIIDKDFVCPGCFLGIDFL